MCELLGFTAKREYVITKLLESFFEHANIHKHGWGMAMYEAGDRHPFIAKESCPANRSKYLYKLLKQDTGIVTHLGIAHIRYASKGNISIVNTHPFVRKIRGTDWVLAHNGTLYGNIYKGKRKSLGKTDSEKILCRISDALAKTDKITEVTEIEKTLEKLTPGGQMNLIFSDGERLFIYCNRAETLYVNTTDKYSVIMTKPVTKTGWKQVELNRLLIYKDGKQIYMGRRLYDETKTLFSESEWGNYIWRRYQSFEEIEKTSVFQGNKKDA
jgi:predicted glutamine amidotransferase